MRITGALFVLILCSCVLVTSQREDSDGNGNDTDANATDGSEPGDDGPVDATAAPDSTETSNGGVDETGDADSEDSTGASQCAAGRTDVDRPDDSTLPQVHVVYARPSDGEDRGLDTDGTLAASVAVWNDWLAERTGGPLLRLDTCDDVLDVTYFELSMTDADVAALGAFVRDEIEAEMAAAGAIAPNKLYAVYYDGSSTYACGGGAFPPTLVGRAGAMYLRGTPPDAPPCPQNFAARGESAGYLEHAMLHELIHTLGLAATCAPSSDGFGHTTDDPTDLMYAGPLPWTPELLDVGNDDYWQHRGNSCLDLATSALLDPTPERAWLPPGW